MKKKLISLCAISLLATAHVSGGVTLTVPEVTVAPGGTANVVINFDLGTPAYTAYQFDIAYPQGISSLNDEEGNPDFVEGDVYARSHNVSSIYTAKGLDRFQCFSVSSAPLTAQNGTLLTLSVGAKASMAEGTYQATISPIEFVQTDATPDRPGAVTFTIKVSKDVVTGISEIVNCSPSNSSCFDLQGRRVAKPGKGMYIKNGKIKVIKGGGL